MRSSRLRGSYLGADPFGLGGSVLIVLEPPLAPLLAEETLRERFGLTPQECRIARLLAAGQSNAEVGQRLHGESSLDARSGTRRSQ